MIVPRAVGAIDIDQVVGEVDIDHVVSEVDVNAVVARVDVNAVVERVDVDAVIQRVDVNAVVGRVDINAIIGQVDLDTVLKEVDLDALVARLDLDALLEHLDVDQLMSRIDLDSVLDRVDLDPVLAKLDLNALLERVDVAALAKRAGIDEIVSDATRGVFGRMLDLVRRQVVALDLVLIGTVNHLFRRPNQEREVRSGTVTGELSGGISRLAAWALDAAFIATAYGLAVAAFINVFDLLTNSSVENTNHSWAWLIGYVAFGYVYYWGALSITGRSIGKGVVGLRVVGRDDQPITPGAAALRTLVYPFSFILGLGLVGIVVGKHRRALHDWAAGTTVRYDWGDRPAELPAPLTAWLQRRTSDQDLLPARPGDTPTVS
jgi:uncharacterized RDD family membrane protein YckC